MRSLKFNFSPINNTYPRVFLLIIFLSTFTFSAMSQVPDRPNAVYNPDTDSYFELVRDGSDWYEAFDKAQALAPDGWTSRLAPLATEEERDFVIAEFGLWSYQINWTGLECEADPDKAYRLAGDRRGGHSLYPKTSSYSEFYVEYTPDPAPVPLGAGAYFLFFALTTGFILFRKRRR